MYMSTYESTRGFLLGLGNVQIKEGASDTIKQYFQAALGIMWRHQTQTCEFHNFH